MVSGAGARPQHRHLSESRRLRQRHHGDWLREPMGRYLEGSVDAAPRHQRIRDTWHHAAETFDHGGFRNGIVQWRHRRDSHWYFAVVGLLLAGAVLLFLRGRRSKRRQGGDSREDEAAAAAAAKEKAELGHDERRKELTGWEGDLKWEMGHDERRHELTDQGSAPKWELGHDDMREMQGANERTPVELFDARSHSHGGEAELHSGGWAVSSPRFENAQVPSPPPQQQQQEVAEVSEMAGSSTRNSRSFSLL